MRINDLEQTLQTLTEAKVLNLDVTLGTLVKAGALSGIDPWDIWCGNGWIVRRRGPWNPHFSIEAIREVVHEELRTSGVLKVG